ncbi:mslnl [Pungitius sinensis]
MTASYLYLLVYLLGSCLGPSVAQSNETCTTTEGCVQGPADPTSRFLRCVGLPPRDAGADHVRRLRGMLAGAMDVYTFMRSSAKGVPLLSLEGELALNPAADPLHSEALVQMWLEVKIRPLLKSVSRHFLSCLSTKNFSCATYQTVVREFSLHYSEMEPVRQKWIYSFFMYPFLSGDRVAGCVSPQQSSEDWLMKNFGAFRAEARMEDLATLNLVFSGLEVLGLLSPAQKAELLLRPEVSGLDNGTLSLVLHSLLAGGPPPTAGSGGGLEWGTGQNWTDPGTPAPYLPRPTSEPHPPPSPLNKLKQILSGVMAASKPLGSFVRHFVSFTREREAADIKSTTLTQFLLNWTLAELADAYRPPSPSVVTEAPQVDLTDVEAWYQHAVVPVLRRFLPGAGALMHPNIKLAFHKLFYLDHNTMENDTSEVQDICSITLDESQCGLTDAVANVAHVMHCAADSNLTMSEETVARLIEELTQRLNSLMQELLTSDLGAVVSDFQQLFREPDAPSPSPERLDDPAFIKLWFKVKVEPLGPYVPVEVLSCLSAKNFSCPAFQTLVAAFSENNEYGYSYIYLFFIYPFLLNHNTNDPQCVMSANNSAEWLTKNFGAFLQMASVADFYKLNPNFSGLDVLPLLSPRQLAEMLVLPLPTPPERDVVINRVFDFLLESPKREQLSEVVFYLRNFIPQVKPPCIVYELIFDRLYRAIPLVPPDIEPSIWTFIGELMSVAPDECVPADLMCPEIPYNGTIICEGVNSSQLLSYMNPSMEVNCGYTLETYACAQLENFTANQLVSLLKCNLPGNSLSSRVLWKTLLTKLSFVLDPALDILADQSTTTTVGSSASAVLDVIGDIRVSMLTDEQLMNSSVVDKWFSRRLSAFLPFASGRFLHCLTRRNLSCHSYQQILQEFNARFDNLTYAQQRVVLEDFILRFLRQPHSGADCVSASNNSAEWVVTNLGPFLSLLDFGELLQLSPELNFLEVVQFLTPKQAAELVSLLPDSPKKDSIINKIFDRLTESPEEIPIFLYYLDNTLYQANLSCSSYKILLDRLDMITPTVPVSTVSLISNTVTLLSYHMPTGCILNSGECNVTITNESDICVRVNSTLLQFNLGQTNRRFCDFSVEEIACASLPALTAEDLAAILVCNRSSVSGGSRPVWKLLLSKASGVLDAALDLLTNTTLDPRNPAVSTVLDAIREIRLDMALPGSLSDPAFIQLWFQTRLGGFLPAASTNFLSCLAAKGLNCTSYQRLVQILSDLRPRMTLAGQISVYTHFMKSFLSRKDTADPSCSSHINSSGEWLQKNLGGFSFLASFHDLRMLYSNFSALTALPQLTVRQLAEVSAAPGQLTSPETVAVVTGYIPDGSLAAFFDDFSPAITGHENNYPSGVRSAFLQVVFNRANLSDPSTGDEVVLEWLLRRVRPLLVGLSPQHVAPFFRILAGRNCSIQQQGVEILNSTISSLSQETQKEIHNSIVQTLTGPIPLKCYGDNYNLSFYGFLERSFLGFQFPNLTAFLSLMPPGRMHQLLNSIPPSALGNFLRRPDVVDNDAGLCAVYDNYIQTPTFLDTEPLPESVRRPTLPCVWPVALGSSSRSEVNAWFDRRLRNYLAFLTRGLISPSSTQNASCLAFQKLVSVLGEYNYTAVDFGRRDVFDSIRAYLASAAAPRCYDPGNADLNSTAWFAEYLGPFMAFLTLEDLQTFGSAQVIQVFTVNPLNIALLNHTSIPLNLTNYYVQLVYQQDSNFNPLLLPLLGRCVAPGPAFSQLSPGESMMVLQNLTAVCTSVDPQISAALAGNFGNGIDASVISALGASSTGLSTGQIKAISPQQLLIAINTLSGVPGWNQGQAWALVQSLVSSGGFEINGTSSLLLLGTLIVGVPARAIGNVNASALLTASKNPSFLEHMAFAPQIIQQIFVYQITTLDRNADVIIQNVPDNMATEIPPALLLGLSNNGSVIQKLNQKKWKRQQAELFFEVIAVESATAALGSPNNLSSSLLQGFTCTGVRSVEVVQIKKLVRACRRTGKNKVPLVETQLTCMYNYIKNDSDTTLFSLYPPDVLLYYNYSLVPQSSCRSYFQQLADADFSVFSSTLSYMKTSLFNNARSCLGITNTSLTEDNISVLGNMCCTLNGSYIRNSHPSILNKLASCPDLSADQVAAAQALLQSGKTPYGAPSQWSEQTLKDLGMLPLYLTSTFYDNFDKKTKRRFLNYFLTVLKSNGVGRQKKRSLMAELRKSIKNKSKRAIVNGCTVGTITQVTISDPTFPFDYDDITQFNCCLSASTVRDNLDAITAKVDQEEYLSVVLGKLREIYPIVPEDQVRLLGPASRLATVADVLTWNITQIDTLSALMNPSDGQWDPTLAKAVITKYLSQPGNTLGTGELNSIGGANLCSLDADVLKNISQQSIKDAGVLTMSNCTLEKQRVLFTIAEQAFATNTRSTIPVSSYQLSAPFIEGAGSAYVQLLSSSGVNMDMSTFTRMQNNVVMGLNVSQVRGLLGANLPDLKLYEDQPLVKSWIATQLQSELDTLGIGLVGGRAGSTDPANSTASPTTNTKPVTATPGTSTTRNNGVNVRADAGFSFLVLLSLLVASFV